MQYKSLRKIGFFILPYTICVAVAFMYEWFAFGNADPTVTADSGIIEGLTEVLSLFCFVVGFLWLSVGSIALMLNRQSGISVASGGIWLFMIAAICAVIFSTFYDSRILGFSLRDKLDSFVFWTVWAGIIVGPAVFFLKKLRKLKC